MRKNRIVSLILAVMLTATVVASALSSGALAFGAVIDVSSEPELIAALNLTEEVDRININASFTVNEDCTILYDAAHLYYYHDTVVTIAEGVTLTVGDGGSIGSYWPSYEGDWSEEPYPDGKLINNGVIIVENGGAVEADFDTNNGSVIVKSGGFCVCPNTNNGTVTVEYRGIYMTTQGLDAYNYGTVTIEPGSVMQSRFGSAIINEAGGNIVLNGEFYCGCFGFEEDVMLFENYGEVTGTGTVILYESDTEIAPVSDMDKLIEKMMGYLGQEKRFDDWDNVSICKAVEIFDLEDLVAATTGERVVAGERVEGDMDTLLTINEDITIPDGVVIETMAFMAIPDDVTLTVSGGASLEAGINNSGTVKALTGAELCSTQGGSIVNNGLMIIEEGALLESHKGSTVTNNGELQLYGNFYAGCLNFGSGDICWFNNYGEMTGYGNIVLFEVAREDFPVEDMDGLIEEVMEKIGLTSRYETWGHINIFKKHWVSTLDEVFAHTTGQRYVAGEWVEYDRDTILELTDDLTIPEDVILSTYASISVPKGIKLTINGTLLCGMYNTGEIEVADMAEFSVAAYSPLKNCGVICVSEFGGIESAMGSDIYNEEGAQIILDGLMFLGCTGTDGEDNLCFKNEGEITGSGKIVVAETDPFNYPLSDTDGLIEEVMAMLGQETRYEDYDDVDIVKYVFAGSYEELAAYFPGDREVAGEHVEGDRDVYVVIYNNIAVQDGTELRTMGTIMVPEGISLTVEDGGVLECNIENDGILEVLSGGSLLTTMGGRIENYSGTMIINEGAELTSQMGSSVINVESAHLTIDGTFFCGYYDNGDDSVIWFENDGEIDGKGRLVLTLTVGVTNVNPDVLVRQAEEELDGSDITITVRIAYIPGDINGDGSVNNKDVVALFKYVSGGGADDISVMALDVTGDGSVNNKDVVALFKYVSGGDVELPYAPYNPYQETEK